MNQFILYDLVFLCVCVCTMARLFAIFKLIVLLKDFEGCHVISDLSPRVMESSMKFPHER